MWNFTPVILAQEKLDRRFTPAIPAQGKQGRWFTPAVPAQGNLGRKTAMNPRLVCLGNRERPSYDSSNRKSRGEGAVEVAKADGPTRIRLRTGRFLEAGILERGGVKNKVEGRSQGRSVPSPRTTSLPATIWTQVTSDSGNSKCP